MANSNLSTWPSHTRFMYIVIFIRIYLLDFSLGSKIIYINTLGRCDQRMLPSVSADM